MKEPVHTCPRCGNKFGPNASDKSTLPFCSKICKMIDLGKWLGEKYVVEGEKSNASIKNDEE